MLNAIKKILIESREVFKIDFVATNNCDFIDFMNKRISMIKKKINFFVFISSNCLPQIIVQDFEPLAD